MSLFTRDVLLGGNTVTEALQTKYGLTFEEAEQLKLTSPPQSIDQAEFTQTLLYAIDPIVLEIERSIDYFRSTSEENDEIREVLLAGGGALIPGFTAELADRLRIPVAPVNPFRTIGIHKQLTGTRDFTHDGPRLAVVTGLALRNLGDKVIKINLLPYHEIEKKETHLRKVTLFMSGMGVIFLGLALFYLWMAHTVSVREGELKGKEDRLALLTKMVGEVDRLKADKQALEKKLAIIADLERGRAYTVRLLAMCQSSTMGEVWLEKMVQNVDDLGDRW